MEAISFFSLFRWPGKGPIKVGRVNLNSSPISKFPFLGGFVTRLLAPKHG